MKKPPVIFLAGERQHAGKTTTSLGIISALCEHMDPADIGYFKPVGQEMVTLPNGERIDKDVLVIHQFTDLEMPISACSPLCAWSQGLRETLFNRRIGLKLPESLKPPYSEVLRHSLIKRLF